MVARLPSSSLFLCVSIRLYIHSPLSVGEHHLRAPPLDKRCVHGPIQAGPRTSRALSSSNYKKESLLSNAGKRRDMSVECHFVFMSGFQLATTEALSH